MPTLTRSQEARTQTKQSMMHWLLWAQQHGYALVERKTLVKNECLAFLEIWGQPRIARERYLFYLPEPVTTSPVTMISRIYINSGSRWYSEQLHGCYSPFFTPRGRDARSRTIHCTCKRTLPVVAQFIAPSGISIEENVQGDMCNKLRGYGLCGHGAINCAATVCAL